MKLDLREILVTPGARLPFGQALDAGRLGFSQVKEYNGPVTASGEIVNTAGVLTARGSIDAEMTCWCDRCGAEFRLCKHVDVDAPIVPDTEEADEGEDEGEEVAIYRIEGDEDDERLVQIEDDDELDEVFAEFCAQYEDFEDADEAAELDGADGEDA